MDFFLPITCFQFGFHYKWNFFRFFFFFPIWTIFKVFVEFITIFYFVFWLFGHKAYGIFAPKPGVEPAPPAVESEVLTTGPPGRAPLNGILPVTLGDCGPLV